MKLFEFLKSYDRTYCEYTGLVLQYEDGSSAFGDYPHNDTNQQMQVWSTMNKPVKSWKVSFSRVFEIILVITIEK